MKQPMLIFSLLLASYFYLFAVSRGLYAVEGILYYGMNGGVVRRWDPAKRRADWQETLGVSHERQERPAAIVQ